MVEFHLWEVRGDCAITITCVLNCEDYQIALWVIEKVLYWILIQGSSASTLDIEDFKTLTDEVWDLRGIDPLEINSLWSIKSKIIGILIVKPVSRDKDCIRSWGKIDIKV
jgi:hypothetical protein